MGEKEYNNIIELHKSVTNEGGISMEHKFRGYTGKKWVYGDLLNQFCGYEIAENNLYWGVESDKIGKFIDNDIEGNPIFEGDIMEIDNRLGGKELYYAIYDKPNYRYSLRRSLKYGGVKLFSNQGKIVGNIYDNADLLNKQETEYSKNYKGIIEEPTCLSKQHINRKVKEFSRK